MALFARAARLDPLRRVRYARFVAAAIPPVSARAWGRAVERGADDVLRIQQPGARTRVALLHAFDPSALAEYRASPESTPLPYRVERLADDRIVVSLTDGMYRGIWRRPVVGGLVVRAERAAAPFVQALLMEREIARSSVTIAMFESQANFVAMARALRIPGFRHGKLMVIECWLARDAPRFSPFRRCLYRFTYRSVDCVVCFSSNQVALLSEALGIPEHRITFVPFGIDSEFFAPATDPVDGDYVLAVGRDAERDWSTFFDAVRNLDVPVKVVCRVERIAGLDVPANVEVLGMVSRAEYRNLLARARVVVIATNPVAYPTGQSVLLEAMSTGRCCVVTETPALVDYLFDDAMLCTPPRDPEALGVAIRRALDDDDLRRKIGARARARVVERFDAGRMWNQIGDLVGSLARAERQS
jgi:glycosyltransferase involved in cell wall biosynthesis